MRKWLSSIPLLGIFVFISCNTPSTEIYEQSIYGIGSITKLELKPINDSIMKRGNKLFDDRCKKCHTMEYKNIGPDISDILAIRKPEWIMNFLLNKEEMLLKDSIAIKTRIRYQENCGAEITRQHEALEILEYLRIYQIWLHEFNAK